MFLCSYVKKRNRSSYVFKHVRMSNSKSMKKQRIIELAVKVIVAALTAFLTAIGTTSCMGCGPF